MCIHLTGVKFSCGCFEPLPTGGPGYIQPALCLPVKQTWDYYHTQPQRPPQPYSLEAPHPCPSGQGNSICICNPGYCALHSGCLKLNHTSLQHTAERYLEKQQSGDRVSEELFSIYNWIPTSGTEDDVGEYEGENGSCKGVECLLDHVTSGEAFFHDNKDLISTTALDMYMIREGKRLVQESYDAQTYPPNLVTTSMHKETARMAESFKKAAEVLLLNPHLMPVALPWQPGYPHVKATPHHDLTSSSFPSSSSLLIHQQLLEALRSEVQASAPQTSLSPLVAAINSLITSMKALPLGEGVVTTNKASSRPSGSPPRASRLQPVNGIGPTTTANSAYHWSPITPTRQPSPASYQVATPTAPCKAMKKYRLIKAGARQRSKYNISSSRAVGSPQQQPACEKLISPTPMFFTTSTNDNDLVVDKEHDRFKEDDDDGPYSRRHHRRAKSF